jgi:hypothetical protein
MTLISNEAIDRRQYWVSEIVQISGNFGDDASRVERELSDELAQAGAGAIIDHLRLCGAIPESYGHDTSEEKLYSKYTDAVLAFAFRQIGLTSIVLTERSDVADVEVIGPNFSFVADAKVFRLSRTAKNQKDFKITAMHSWKRGKPYAVLVAPLYQLPTRTSQIYHQAIAHDVCILSLSHIAMIVSFAESTGASHAQSMLLAVLQSVSTLNPAKDALAYWRTVNRTFLEYDERIRELWSNEKRANLEAIAASKNEALDYLARLRAEIMGLSHSQAVQRLLDIYKIDGKVKTVERVSDSGILELS